MIKLLHSFPSKEEKFKEFCRLTFEIDELDNTYVSNISGVDNLDNFDAIVLHYFRREDFTYLVKYEIELPVVWFCWGADILNQGKFYNKFLLRKTKRLRTKISFKQGFLMGIKQLVKEIFPVTIDFSTVSRTKLLALKKIDFIVPVMPGDFSLIKKNYEVGFALHHLNYVNPLVERDSFGDITGKNILLGNSASYTNNHIEAIDKLSEIELEERKIIIPLSYGNNNIAEYISDYANNKLGDERVIILKEFIPFSEYNDILNSCEIVIMNHQRQQAVGNVVQSLLNGAHLYLREESTVYKYLKDCGIKISSFNKASKLEGLNNDDVILNRAKAKEVFGSETQHKKLMVLFERALK